MTPLTTGTTNSNKFHKFPSIARVYEADESLAASVDKLAGALSDLCGLLSERPEYKDKIAQVKETFGL